nr:ATP-binding protein [Deinobacterium chartae]
MLDQLPQALLLHEAGRVTHLNRPAQELWGVSLQRARGRTILEVVRRHTLEELARHGGELEIETAGRTLLCRGTPGALIITDITEKKARERELREVMAVLSHEFRTPVAGILGVLEALQYEMPPELQQNFVEQGLAEIRRLSRLVEDMTVGFRISTVREFEFGEVMARARRLLENELETRRVRLEVHGEATLVRADPDKLLQVLLNLVENAVRYGPQPGTVQVQVCDLGDAVHLEVIDGGQELPDYQRIFEPHQRGERARGPGSGMGLYIIRTIVEAWGGNVSAGHRPGVGNVFGVSVPKQ